MRRRCGEAGCARLSRRMAASGSGGERRLARAESTEQADAVRRMMGGCVAKRVDEVPDCLENDDVADEARDVAPEPHATHGAKAEKRRRAAGKKATLTSEKV